MNRLSETGLARLTKWILVSVVLLCGLWTTPCSAQAILEPFGSLIPLESVERIFGPLIPNEGFAATFRSELGIGFAGTDVAGAKLKGSAEEELDLRRVMPMDRGPIEYRLYGNMRIWRFGLRGIFSDFEARSKAANRGRFDFSGLILGADFDLIQLSWLTFAVSYDHYFFEPRLEGSMLNPPASSLPPADPRQISPFVLNVNGDAPSTLGTHIRWVPPEILGFPLHIETFHKRPVGGGTTKVISYGGALVFRPQFYRFDLACKLRVERNHVKFEATPTDFQNYGPSGTRPAPGQTWEVDIEWIAGGADVIVYF